MRSKLLLRSALLIALPALAAVLALSGGVSAGRGASMCRLAEPMVLTATPEETIGALAMTPDGGLLAAGTNHGRILVWALPAGRKLFEALGPRRVEALAFSPNGKLLAAATARPGLRLWRMGPKPQEILLPSPPVDVTAVAFSPDGAWLALGDRNRNILLYRLTPNKPPVQRKTISSGHTSWISALAFSPDSKTLYSGGWDARVRAMDIASGRQLWESHVHRFAIDAIVPTPAGIAVSADDGRLTFHRPRDGRVTRQYKPGAMVAMVRDKSLLAGLTWEGKLVFLDANRARVRCAPRIEKGRRRRTWSLALAGPRFAVGDNRGRILVYDLPPRLLAH